jgi:hypothetical protein
MIEVTRSGREVIHINRPMNDVLAARKLKNGQIGVALSNGTCARMDSKGKELSSFTFQSIGTNGVEVLPNGGLLSPTQWQGKVIEYDPQGKIAWQADFQQSWTASRAPNGHTMVGTQMWPPKVYELDKEGKVVWEHDCMSPPMRVRKR